MLEKISQADMEGQEQDLTTTILTCEGDLRDPAFPCQLRRLVLKLRQLISDEEKPFWVKKVEPWNSVRVTFNIPREAAQRLRQLAERGDRVLRELGILSVQIEGDQVITLTLAGRYGEPQEIILSQKAAEPSSSTDQSRQAQPSRESLAVLTSTLASLESLPGPSNAEVGQKSPSPRVGVPGAVPQVVAASAGSGASSAILRGQGATSNQEVGFRSPNVVAPTREPLPFLSGSTPRFPKSSPTRPQTSYGPFPFASMTHAMNTKHNTHQQSKFPYSQPSFTSAPSTSTTSTIPKRPSPLPSPTSNSPVFPVSSSKSSSPVYNNILQRRASTTVGMPPVATTAVTANRANVALSSPLLVNLLQSETGGVQSNKLMPPPAPDTGQASKRKRKPRKPKPKPGEGSVLSPPGLSPSPSPPLQATPSTSNLTHSVPPSNSPVYDHLGVLNSQSFNVSLSNIPNIPLSPPMPPVPSVHLRPQGHPQVLSGNHPLHHLPVNVSPVQRPSHSLPGTAAVVSTSASYCVPAPAVGNPVTKEISSPSRDQAQKAATKSSSNTASNPFPSPPPSTEGKTKHLINPFTGHLEPMPSDEEEEDESISSLPPFPEFELESSENGQSERSLSDGGKDANLSSDTDSGIGKSHTDVSQSSTDCANGDSVKEEESRTDTKTAVEAKSEANAPVHPGSASSVSSVEKLKLRLKLDTKMLKESKDTEIRDKKIKSEVASASHKVDMSFFSIPSAKKVSPSHSPVSSEPRVPPLHISLRGPNAAVVVSPRKEDMRLRLHSKEDSSSLEASKFESVGQKKARPPRSRGGLEGSSLPLRPGESGNRRGSKGDSHPRKGKDKSGSAAEKLREQSLLSGGGIVHVPNAVVVPQTSAEASRTTMTDSANTTVSSTSTPATQATASTSTVCATSPSPSVDSVATSKPVSTPPVALTSSAQTAPSSTSSSELTVTCAVTSIADSIARTSSPSLCPSSVDASVTVMKTVNQTLRTKEGVLLTPVTSVACSKEQQMPCAVPVSDVQCVRASSAEAETVLSGTHSTKQHVQFSSKTDPSSSVVVASDASQKVELSQATSSDSVQTRDLPQVSECTTHESANLHASSVDSPSVLALPSQNNSAFTIEDKTPSQDSDASHSPLLMSNAHLRTAVSSLQMDTENASSKKDQPTDKLQNAKELTPCKAVVMESNVPDSTAAAGSISSDACPNREKVNDVCSPVVAQRRSSRSGSDSLESVQTPSPLVDGVAHSADMNSTDQKLSSPPGLVNHMHSNSEVVSNHKSDVDSAMELETIKAVIDRKASVPVAQIISVEPKLAINSFPKVYEVASVEIPHAVSKVNALGTKIALVNNNVMPTLIPSGGGIFHGGGSVNSLHLANSDDITGIVHTRHFSPAGTTNSLVKSLPASPQQKSGEVFINSTHLSSSSFIGKESSQDSGVKSNGILALDDCDSTVMSEESSLDSDFSEHPMASSAKLASESKTSSVMISGANTSSSVTSDLGKNSIELNCIREHDTRDSGDLAAAQPQNPAILVREQHGAYLELMKVEQGQNTSGKVQFCLKIRPNFHQTRNSQCERGQLKSGSEVGGTEKLSSTSLLANSEISQKSADTLSSSSQDVSEVTKLSGITSEEQVSSSTSILNEADSLASKLPGSHNALSSQPSLGEVMCMSEAGTSTDIGKQEHIQSRQGNNPESCQVKGPVGLLLHNSSGSPQVQSAKVLSPTKWVTSSESPNNRVTLIFKSNLGSPATMCQRSLLSTTSTTSGSVMVPLATSKTVPIKVLTLPTGAASSLSSLVELIGPNATSSHVASSSGNPSSPPVRLVVSKVSPMKTNVPKLTQAGSSSVMNMAAVVVKSVVVTSTSPSLKIVSPKGTVCTNTSTSNTSSLVSSQSVSSELPSIIADVPQNPATTSDVVPSSSSASLITPLQLLNEPVDSRMSSSEEVQPDASETEILKIHSGADSSHPEPVSTSENKPSKYQNLESSVETEQVTTTVDLSQTTSDSPALLDSLDSDKVLQTDLPVEKESSPEGLSISTELKESCEIDVKLSLNQLCETVACTTSKDSSSGECEELLKCKEGVSEGKEVTTEEPIVKKEDEQEIRPVCSCSKEQKGDVRDACNLPGDPVSTHKTPEVKKEADMSSDTDSTGVFLKPINRRCSENANEMNNACVDEGGRKMPSAKCRPEDTEMKASMSAKEENEIKEEKTSQLPSENESRKGRVSPIAEQQSDNSSEEEISLSELVNKSRAREKLNASRGQKTTRQSEEVKVENASSRPSRRSTSSSSSSSESRKGEEASQGKPRESRRGSEEDKTNVKKIVERASRRSPANTRDRRSPSCNRNQRSSRGRDQESTKEEETEANTAKRKTRASAPVADAQDAAPNKRRRYSKESHR